MQLCWYEALGQAKQQRRIRTLCSKPDGKGIDRLDRCDVRDGTPLFAIRIFLDARKRVHHVGRCERRCRREI
jgi:hypothetical protein